MKTPLFFLATFLFSGFFSIPCQLNAQPRDQRFFCDTPPLKSNWLVKFQQDLPVYERTSGTLYIPVTLHMVGTDEGEGHIPLQTALDRLCRLNQFFAAAEIHFFLEGAVNYINHTDWSLGNQAVNMMNANNVDSTINCYIIGGAAISDYSGFYSSAGDAIVMIRQAFIGYDALFPHEIGHYLSLPHTFLGWENMEWDFSTPAPEYVGGTKVERVDGLDCEIAGDGFCDTPPDYLSGSSVPYFCNGNEASFIFQTDPTGATFQSDCSLIMSYALTPHRFSDLQINAMRANIEQVRPYLLYNQNPLPELTDPEVVLTSPSQGSIVSPDDPLNLAWEPVPDATHYLVEITFLPVFSAVYDQYILASNSLVLENLLPGKKYRWRVLPFNAFRTCAPYSEEGLFYTNEPAECLESQLIGITVYDLQTNGSVCNRTSQDAEGNLMATWTMSIKPDNGFADRGTGYNRFDAASETWQAVPVQRLEPDTRTGWPNHTITDSGTELIVNHVFTGQGVFLRTLRRTVATGDWVEGDVPTNAPRGVITARMISSGETIHVIAPATPLNFGGVVYAGVNGHILYYRSPDGGVTWDIVDGIIPGLDNTFMADLGNVDCYAIDARGEVVAVAVFSNINDVQLFKSADGGNSWTSTRISDFPIDKYETDQGYTLDDLPPPHPQQPDPYAIFTADNSGSVLVDRNGTVHVFYGQMYIKDINTQDRRITTFPNTSGIAYWNESFGPDSIRTIADVVDLNGNNTIDIDPVHLADYFLSMTTHPSPAVAEDNHIYLAYSAVMEGAEYRQNYEARQFRHIAIVHSGDGGDSWSQPYDAINEKTLCDADFPFFTEAVYPSMVRDIAEEVLFLYQYDFRPGFSIGNPAETNFIGFSRIDVSEFEVTPTAGATAPEGFALTLQPNPATNSVTISYELEYPAPLALQIYNLMGQVMLQRRSQNLGAGGHSMNLDVSNLPDGLYLVQLQVGQHRAVKKLAVN